LKQAPYNLNWIDTWTGLGINTVKLENYWNNGSPKEQHRFIDNFVISTSRIGLSPSPRNPRIYLESNGSDTLEIQISKVKSSENVIWQGKTVQKSVRVDNSSGAFISAGKSLLDNGEHFVRCRYTTGTTSNWSDWKVFFVSDTTTKTSVPQRGVKKTSYNQKFMINIAVQMQHQMTFQFTIIPTNEIKQCNFKLYTAQGKKLIEQTKEYPTQFISITKPLTKGLYIAKVAVTCRNGSRIKSCKEIVVL
jgi:hypothetical protein